MMDNTTAVPKIRESNIELCRIISMFMIIAHHLVLHGGLISVPEMFPNKWLGYIILPGGKVGFDAFIAISAWFLAGSDFRAERFFKTYFQVIFYSVTTALAAILLGTSIPLLQFLGTFLPLTGSVQGYAATYLAFYLLMPFLAILSRNINDRQHLFIIGVLTVFTIAAKIVGSATTTEQSCYSRVTLFVFFYFLLGYIKTHPVKSLENPFLMLFVFIVNWGVIVVCNCQNQIWGENKPEFLNYTIPLISGESGLLYIIGGLSLFFFFKSIKIKPNRVINLFASTTLAVLLIHDGHFFRKTTWSLLKTSEWYYSRHFLIRAGICVVGIYLFCSVIEFMRRKFIEKPFFRLGSIKKLCEKTDKAARSPVNESRIPQPQDTEKLEAQINELKKELDRKDHALAEIAARYALKEE